MKLEPQEIVLKLLNIEQKEHRMDIAQEILTTFNSDPDLLKEVITGDESWMYDCGIETKDQLSQWKCSEEPREKKASQVRSNFKVVLTVFFDCNTVVHHEFLPQARGVKKEYCLEVMCQLSKRFIRKAQTSVKTNHGFCTMIMHQLTYRCLCLSFWPKT